jgi:AraC family transcriptional regulator of adaptative response / DNA-3-methyladenine glycosylase II
MLLDPQRCYQALKTHDARFDGRFFVGVSSTGIYCRPVCSGRAPKAANCSFYPSAAAAEAAGYRPCLRCRPVLRRIKRICNLARDAQQLSAALGGLGARNPGLHLPGAFDAFGAAARGILGQQVTASNAPA